MKSQRIKIRKGGAELAGQDLKGVTPDIEALDFQGETVARISGEALALLSRFPHLKSLTFACPKLGHVPAALFELSDLTTLKIKGGAKVAEIEGVPKRPAPLRHLFLSGLSLKRLPEWFSDLGQLETLDLSGNSLTNLPADFARLTKLKRLSLDQNEFKALPAVLEGMKGMNHLSLDGNAFNDDEKARIQRVLGIWF